VLWLESLEEVGQQASGGGEGGVSWLSGQGAVGQEQQGDVGGVEVGAQLSGLAGTLDQLRQTCFGAGAFVIVIEGVGEVSHEYGCEASIGYLCGAHLFEERAQAAPRIGVREGLVENGRALAEFFGEGGGDERVAGGESAVEGRHTDTGAAGDGAHRGVGAARREHLARGVDEAVPVAPGISAQG